MSEKNTEFGFSDEFVAGDLAGVLHDSGVRITVDLVAAARRHLIFLRRIAADSTWLHHTPTLRQAIRRYDELWMPLISDHFDGSTVQMILPPLDIQYVWHCHCLIPAKYQKYCTSRFSRILEKPPIFDDENEDYAVDRCRELWSSRYPSEPFDLELVSDDAVVRLRDGDLFDAIIQHIALYSKFTEPYMSEKMYLIAAKHRYKGFLYLLQRYRDGYSRLVPTCDILLTWLTHQSFASTYGGDLEGIEEDLENVDSVWDQVKEEDLEITKKLWERTFDQPYEKAGTNFDGVFNRNSPVYWDVSEVDVNRKYKAMEPRFLLELCVFVKGKWENNEAKKTKRTFLRLRTMRCHGELKLDKPVSEMSSSDSWRKTWHLYCEFGTRGIALELRRHGGACFKKSKSLKTIIFSWNDLLRAPSLALERQVEGQMRVVASITPPVQVPYLLKCVPDRVTDDSGAMISDVILRMNRYRPQEGRWLCRTVLDHTGRECFIIRIRVGEGFWRRGAETPASVKREDRIIEIREGSWSYVEGSIGIAPKKVAGTATPREEESQEKKKSIWCLATGDVLTIQWEGGFSFQLENENPDESVKLLIGRKWQYQAKDLKSERQEEEEDGFVTLVRFAPENPNGKATALLNWRHLAVELSPEEDAVLALLVCVAITRTVSEIRREDVGNLLVRRRIKEVQSGSRDWGSVIVPSSSSSSSSPTSFSSSSSSTCFLPHLQPWHWNAKEVLASAEAGNARQPTIRYSPAEGGDRLYKRGIMS